MLLRDYGSRMETFFIIENSSSNMNGRWIELLYTKKADRITINFKVKEENRRYLLSG